ncbi:hypothetical protein PVL30_001800 [Lodderomyces elongisporus]|uniref:uncharacterized protein n=1 Tax=Lodderomyces elongisporus TaxID=36914 RepID=UPI0029229AA4|nr:uncharacterized protein PVL30_001800 [Lodderomyces elongisporus]WLF78074.1 hypothetical protein PVL30_001800 [Lodderomyces elongisporus]
MFLKAVAHFKRRCYKNGESSPITTNGTSAKGSTIQSDDNDGGSLHSLVYSHSNPSFSLEQRCFESLPSSIICKIFILAGPGNNLPLVNRNLYETLQFSGEGISNIRSRCSSNSSAQMGRDGIMSSRGETTDGIWSPGTHKVQTTASEEPRLWHNYSLVIEMVKSYFLYDLNTKIDEQIIEKKLNFYAKKIKSLPTLYVECERSGYYEKTIKNLDILSTKWQRYKSFAGRFVLEESLLNYKFLSRKLLQTFTAQTFESTRYKRSSQEDLSELLRFKSRDEIELNTWLRPQFLKFKFEELDMLLAKTESELNSNHFEDVSQLRTFDRYFDMLANTRAVLDGSNSTNSTNSSSNNSNSSSTNNSNNNNNNNNNSDSSSFFSFEEENPPILLSEAVDFVDDAFEANEKNYYNFEFGYNFGRTFFGETPTYRKRCQLPRKMYLNSIKSLRAFEVLESLTYFIPNISTQSDSIIQEILQSLYPSNMDFQLHVPFLSVVILILQDGGAPGDSPTTLINSLLEAFSLYHLYTTLPIEDYGVTSKGQNMLENLYDGIKYMCLYLLGAEHDEVLRDHKRQLWALSLKLKNYDLSNLLSKFAPNPDLDILSQHY